MSSVARSAIRRTRAQRAHLTVIFVPVTGWLARGGRPVSSCRRGHRALRPVPSAAGCRETARGSRCDAGLPPGGSGDAAAASGGRTPQARAADCGFCVGLAAWCLAVCPGAWRGPSRLARRRRALEAVGKVVTGRKRTKTPETPENERMRRKLLNRSEWCTGAQACHLG